MDKIQEDLAKDYSEYIKVDIHDEISHLEETIEDMLTRLEEFESLMEGVHLECSSSVAETVPEIQECCKSLEGLFNRVDQVESLVSRVKTDLASMESRLDAAETETAPSSSDLGLRSFLKPLFYKKPEAVPSTSIKSPTYEPPNIFKTEEFFPAAAQQES